MKARHPARVATPNDPGNIFNEDRLHWYNFRKTSTNCKSGFGRTHVVGRAIGARSRLSIRLHSVKTGVDAQRPPHTDPQILILASLADGEKHGCAMMEDIERFGGVRLGAGTLYGAITRLEEQGWIERVESEDRRKPYRITGLGVKYLEEQMDSLLSVWKTVRQRLRHV